VDSGTRGGIKKRGGGIKPLGVDSTNWLRNDAEYRDGVKTLRRP